MKAILLPVVCVWLVCLPTLRAADAVEVPKSLFVSIAALSRHSDAEVRKWFEHIATCHRSPGSPQRINSLVLTSIAAVDPKDPEGTGALLLASPPPGADPTGYAPATGNRKLDIVSAYFKNFDSIYVGTLNIKWKGEGTKYNVGIQDADFRRKNVQVSTNVMDRFMATYPELPFRWYISYEANLNYFTDTRIKDGYAAYCLDLCREMKKRRDAEILWSPNFWSRYGSLTDPARSTLAANLKDYFAHVPITEVHFQDHEGGSSHYTASRRFTVDDTKHYYDLLQGLGGPRIAVNAELFVRKVNPKGFTTMAMSREGYAQRMKDYARLRLPLGACWEMTYWYQAHWDAAACEAPKTP